MKPFAANQEVFSADEHELELQRRAGAAVDSRHVIEARHGRRLVSKIFNTIRQGVPYYFYRLRDSDLLWPHPALRPSLRRLKVHEARPPPLRSPRPSLGSSADRHRVPDAPEPLGPAYGRMLYVGNMHFAMRDASLLRLFSSFGDLEEFTIVVDKLTHRSKAFGFVTFLDVRSAQAAAEQLNNAAVTSTGELSGEYESDSYRSWLKQGWDVQPTDLRPYDQAVAAVATAVWIIEESSRRLAECVAEHPGALAQIEWRDFERMLVTVFNGLGFNVAAGRGSKDGGVDLRISTDSQSYVVQAKHWVSGKRVGRTTLNALLAVAKNEGTDALVLSTSGFTRTAATAVLTFDRPWLRIGEKGEIWSLCRLYVGIGQGVLSPINVNTVIDTHTRQLKPME